MSDITATLGFSDISYDFFKLPSELRTKIYNLLMKLGDNGSAASLVEINAHKEFPIRRRQSAQLLRTCKVIYEEALPILASSHNFKATDFGLMKRTLVRLGSFSHLYIKHLTIDLGGFPSLEVKTVTRELISLGAVAAPVQGFPALPDLRTVTFCAVVKYTMLPKTASRDCPPLDRPAHESFLARLAASDAAPGHKLYDIMQTVEYSPLVKWYLNLHSHRYDWVPRTEPRDHGLPPIIVQRWEIVEKRRAYMSVSIEDEVKLDGQSSRRWVVDA